MAAAKPKPVAVDINPAKWFKTSTDRHDACGAIADAVLIINWAMTQDVDIAKMVPTSPNAIVIDTRNPLQFLRAVQGRLLESYRETMNIPHERFYIDPDKNGGNGRSVKRAETSVD